MTKQKNKDKETDLSDEYLYSLIDHKKLKRDIKKWFDEKDKEEIWLKEERF